MVETALLTLGITAGATISGSATGLFIAAWNSLRKTRKPNRNRPQNESTGDLRGDQPSGIDGGRPGGHDADDRIGLVGICGEELGAGWSCPLWFSVCDVQGDSVGRQAVRQVPRVDRDADQSDDGSDSESFGHGV